MQPVYEQATDWMTGVRVPVESRIFFLISKSPRQVLGPTQTPIQCIHKDFPEG